MLPVPLPAPRSAFRIRSAWFCLLLTAFLPLGCGEKLPPLAPVKGKVFLPDGKPLTSGQVSFVRETVDPDVKLPPSSGTIDSDGNYEIKTGGNSGAPLAKYKVTVTPDMSKGGMEQPKGEPLYDQKYKESTKTPFKFEVVESPEAGRYDLKLTK